MAFQNKNLSVIAYANGFTLWHYAANETLATITASGYFNIVKTLMNTGVEPCCDRCDDEI